MRLTNFTQVTSGMVRLAWDDGHAGPISLRRLRDGCPCAHCSGETVLLASYVPPPADTSVPGRYDLRGATPVGNYALQFRWGDGHGEGIYTWGVLRNLCECPACAARAAGGTAHGR